MKSEIASKAGRPHRKQESVRQLGRLPGDPMVKNLPCNARDMGSTPGQRTKTPYATE